MWRTTDKELHEIRRDNVQKEKAKNTGICCSICSACGFEIWVKFTFLGILNMARINSLKGKSQPIYSRGNLNEIW